LIQNAELRDRKGEGTPSYQDEEVQRLGKKESPRDLLKSRGGGGAKMWEVEVALIAERREVERISFRNRVSRQEGGNASIGAKKEEKKKKSKSGQLVGKRVIRESIAYTAAQSALRGRA